MTKRFKSLSLAVMSIILAIMCTFMYCTDNYRQTKASTEAITRNIEVSKKSIDYESVFEEFEDPILETEGSLTTFEGVKTFDLADFDELDLVADVETGETPKMQVKYNYSYDCEANMVTLTATMVGDEDEPLIDTMYGMAFVNEKGELDAVFDCDDGEYITLSELQDADMIANCGWFKKAFKKVGNAIKKVCSTTIGLIGAAVTIAAPFAFAVTFSMIMPVGAVIAVGALIGAGAAATTAAVSTYVQDGKVDWETVGICTGVGAAVGALGSAIGYYSSNSNGSGDVSSSEISKNKLSGKWQVVNENMSEASRAYQTQITGHTGEAFVQNGVKFDGVLNGNLIDAKCHYSQFVDKNTGMFYDWFNGSQSLIDEATRQIQAADGVHIQWYFAEQDSLFAVQRLFSSYPALKSIELIFKAPI